MKKIIRNIFIFTSMLSFIIIPIENTSSARLILPDSDYEEDVNIGNPQISSSTANESTIFEYIKIINSYLWFSIGGIALAILMYAGIQMITAGGDKGKVGKAGKMALYSLIGIVVAMMSYAIVTLVINLV